MMNGSQLDCLFVRCAREYERACKKHPVFPANPTNDPEWQRLIRLKRLRGRANHDDTAPDCTIQSVQEGEMLEAVAEAVRGNWRAAFDETLHLIATAMRAAEYYARMAGDIPL